MLVVYSHRETSTLANEIPEESEQFRFLRAACFTNIKGSVGLILAKASAMQISIPLDLSSRPCIPSVVYYESMKRKLKIKPIYECRCNGRLQTKRFTRLQHTGLVVELEHLKIKTRLTNEKFASVKGECEI